MNSVGEMHQHSPFPSVNNPVISPRPGQIAVRDCALFNDRGVIHCFYTGVWWHGSDMVTHLEHRCTLDLHEWTEPEMIGLPTLWSPGNVIKVGNRYCMVCQHQPVTMPNGDNPKGKMRHDCRLWLMWSDDLAHWSYPRIVMPSGCEAKWSPDSRRQIDGCLVEHDGRFWILCKQGNSSTGRMGLLVSDDFEHWETVETDGPVIGPHNTDDPGGLENPCIVKDGEEYVCFFPRYTKPAALLRSRDLINWYGLTELKIPMQSWMLSRPNAPAVIDTRELNGKWLMAFFSSNPSVVMSAHIGLAWSDDLIHWETN